MSSALWPPAALCLLLLLLLLTVWLVPTFPCEQDESLVRRLGYVTEND